MTNPLEVLLDQIQKDLIAKKAEYEAVMREYLKQAYQTIFDLYPNLKSFGWRQGTPAWNDGDTCYFYVNYDDIYINGYCLSDDEYEDKKLSISDAEAAADKVSVLLSNYGDATLQDIYGDCVLVTVKRDLTHESDYTSFD